MSLFFGGALRDIPKNGCEGDYVFIGTSNFGAEGANQLLVNLALQKSSNTEIHNTT